MSHKTRPLRIVEAVGHWPSIGIGMLAAAGLVYWNAATTMLGG